MLVVEDELLVAMGLEMVLVDAGYAVVGPIGSIDEAVRAVEAGATEIDIALLDVNLKGDRVYPVADALARRGIPFAFLTGYGRETLPDRFQDRAMLTKPFRPVDLFATVERMVPVAH